MSTLTQLRAAVRARTDTSASDTGLADATGVLDGFINAALKRISLDGDFEWLQTKVVGNVTSGVGGNIIAQPADLGRIIYIVLTDTGERLSRVPRQELVRIPSTTTGRPRIWAFATTGTVEVRPAPDATYPYELFYFRTEPALTVAGNSPLIPTAYDDGVVEFASYLAFRFLHRFEESKVAHDAYGEWLRGAKDDETRSRGGLKVRVRPGGFL